MNEPITVVDLQPRRIASVRRTVPQRGLGAFFSEVYPKILGLLAAQRATPAGPPLARYFNNDPRADLNSDGKVDSLDFFRYIDRYLAGCGH